MQRNKSEHFMNKILSSNEIEIESELTFYRELNQYLNLNESEQNKLKRKKRKICRKFGWLSKFGLQQLTPYSSFVNNIINEKLLLFIYSNKHTA